jgi:hypothetical protein
MYMNAYHKDQGEVRMFEVDARNAIARFPGEWSDRPWPDEEAESAGISAPKRGRTRKAEEKPPEEADEGEGEAQPETEGE